MADEVVVIPHDGEARELEKVPEDIVSDDLLQLPTRRPDAPGKTFPRARWSGCNSDSRQVLLEVSVWEVAPLYNPLNR